MIYKTIRDYYKCLLLSTIVIIPLFSFVVASINAEENPYGFGIPANDGTAIQIYYQTETRLRGANAFINVRIPQDEAVLEVDYFYVLIDVRDSNMRFFTVEHYEYNKTTNDSTVMKYRKTFNLTSGQNAWNDRRFGQIRIDESNFYTFTQSDELTVFVVYYQNLVIKFYHQTNPSLVSEIVTRGDFTSTILYYGVLGMIILSFTLFATSRIKKEMGTWIKFTFSSVALIFSWMLLGFLGLAIMEGLTDSDILRQLIQVPVTAILFVVAVVMALWVTSWFVPKPIIMHVIKYDSKMDIESFLKNYVFGGSIKDPKKFIEVGYEQLQIVHTEKGRRVYRNANSIVEIIGTFLHGSTAIKSTKKAFVIEVNLETPKLYKKTFYERIQDKYHEFMGSLGFHLDESDQKVELLFVKDMKWKKTQINKDSLLYKILDDFRITTLLFTVFSLIVLIVIAFSNSSFEIISFFVFVLALIYVVYAIYYYTKKFKYLEIDPLERSVLEAIRDGQIAAKIENVSSEVISELVRERDFLRQELVRQEYAHKGKWLVEWEKALTGKVRSIDLPQIEEFENQSNKKTKGKNNEPEVSEESKDSV